MVDGDKRERGKTRRGGITFGLISLTTLKVTLCALTYAKIGTLAAFGAIMGPLLPPTIPWASPALCSPNKRLRTGQPTPPLCGTLSSLTYVIIRCPQYALRNDRIQCLCSRARRHRMHTAAIAIRVVLAFIWLGREIVDPGLCSFRNKPSPSGHARHTGCPNGGFSCIQIASAHPEVRRLFVRMVALGFAYVLLTSPCLRPHVRSRAMGMEEHRKQPTNLTNLHKNILVYRRSLRIQYKVKGTFKREKETRRHYEAMERNPKDGGPCGRERNKEHLKSI